MKKLCMLLSLIAPLFFVGCDRENTSRANAGDVNFAKSTFESLARGDSSVVDKIDWATFTALGSNVGAQFSSQATSVDKEKFVNLYITQFATSFRNSGGNIGSYSNWRVTAHDPSKTEVAADSSDGVLMITVTERDGMERVSALNVIR